MSAAALTGSYQHGPPATPSCVEEGGYRRRTSGKTFDNVLDSPFSKNNMEQREWYNWKEFWKCGDVVPLVEWLITGRRPTRKDKLMSDDELQYNLRSLARLLILLRQYQHRFGIPQGIGGPEDQEYVLRELTRDLYSGGTPSWALEPAMTRVAEGLTGKRGEDFILFPRKALIVSSSTGTTTMFQIDRGFQIQKLDAMEKVAVRLASFASNTHSVTGIPSRWPQPHEFEQAFRTESMEGLPSTSTTADDMAAEILTLASEAQGLVFYVNCKQDEVDSYRQYAPPLPPQSSPPQQSSTLEFWKVDDATRQLFSCLATIEAIAVIDKDHKKLYPQWAVTIFRMGSSAGACAIWFHGSWPDIFVASVLASAVASIGTLSALPKQERIILETVASFAVGLTAGIIALLWPDHTCYGAIAVAGVLDLLQGFRIVYAIIEVMSKHTVTGAADLLEGVLFTGLIAYFLKFGQYSAVAVLGRPVGTDFPVCTNGIRQEWFLFFVPLAALSWSGLFDPNYVDLPWMTYHGLLAYIISWVLAHFDFNLDMNNFVAALAVTFSASLVSRVTGRQAQGNTVAGLYVLVPGAYLVNQLLGGDSNEFLSSIVLRAVVIGIGAWTGTLLCSPTVLGATSRRLATNPSYQMLQLARQTDGSRTSSRRQRSFNSLNTISSHSSVRRNSPGQPSQNDDDIHDGKGTSPRRTSSSSSSHRNK